MQDNAKTRARLLMAMTFVAPLSFSVWMALLNNFVVEKAKFSGAEIGLLHSVREVPGFLAFTAVFVLLVVREQIFALLSLLLLGIGVALTGYFPSVVGLYLTTVLMSVGFHYFETVQQSLSLQWLPKERTAQFLGKLSATRSISALLAFGFVWLSGTCFAISYQWTYLIAGSMTVGGALLCWLLFPRIETKHAQNKHLVFRRRYRLYYALVFMSGARRQIFVVFASFMMVERFGYSVSEIASLYLLNHVINTFASPYAGKLIAHIGERRALMIEYVGLIIVFSSYAVVADSRMAAGLYVVDHLLFGMAMATKTYFQKIADPADISSTAAVSFTINHIAAVIIPALFGLLWLQMPSAVFLLGAAMAVVSFALATRVPRKLDLQAQS